MFDTAKEMDLTYSRSINSWGETWRQCFVYNNTLYYMTDEIPVIGTRTIKYSKDRFVHNMTTVSSADVRFWVVDEKTLITQSYVWSNIPATIYLDKPKEGTRVKLCKGILVGVCDNRLYYVNDNTLYEMDLSEKEEAPILSYDTLLGNYYDGIVYQADGYIYSFLFESLEPSLILAPGVLDWFDGESWFLTMDPEFLFTDTSIVRITPYSIKTYSMSTGEIDTIFAPDLESDLLHIAATAHQNIMYVSVQRTDIANWTIRDKEINGLYKYDFVTKEWTKISSKTYGSLMQFDDQYLYGTNEYRLINIGNVERIPLN